MPAIKSDIEEEPADSFTSMIDIVFLLLIFFILQPFKSPERKLPAELPKDEGPSHSPAEPQKHIVLKIEANPENPDIGVYNVDGKRITFEPVKGHSKGGVYSLDGQQVDNGIASRLTQVAMGDKDAPIAIMPKLNVQFKHVLRALDQCYEAQMETVKFEGPPLDNYVPGGDGRR